MSRSDRLGFVLMRVAIAIVFIWIGWLKFAPYEADSITPFVANNPMMSLFYEHPEQYRPHLTREGELVPAQRAWQQENHTYAFADGLGTVEITIGLLVLCGLVPTVWGAALGSAGAVLAFLTSFVTLSFLLTTPEAWVPALGDAQHGFPYLSGGGRLVLKDVMLLAGGCSSSPTPPGRCGRATPGRCREAGPSLESGPEHGPLDRNDPALAHAAAVRSPVSNTRRGDVFPEQQRKIIMPFARIDMIRGKSTEFRRTVGDVVYQAMHEILGAPKDDRFQVIAEHTPNDFIFDPEFLGIHRTQGCIFVQLTLVAGRTLDQKRTFYKRVADDLHTKLGVRREDVCINLVPVNADDWSFGNGEASLIK